MKPCHCIIRHARTPEERVTASKNLDNARALGDATGITILLASLSPCKSDPVRDAANEPGYATKVKP